MKKEKKHGGEQSIEVLEEPVAARRRHTREHMNLGARPGGSAPDKRSRIDPTAAKIPPRSGGPVLF